MYKVPEFKISDFVESLPIKVKFLNSADSRPKHPDNAATVYWMDIYVWTELLCLNLLGLGNSHVTYLDHFRDWVPKNSL